MIKRDDQTRRPGEAISGTPLEPSVTLPFKDNHDPEHQPLQGQ
jgi:hypothetical protein